jgi:RimJ/RimL family protein N-acetyltransferase
MTNNQPSTMITTARLRLVPLTAPLLEAALVADQARVSALLGSTVPTELFAKQGLYQLRLGQLRADPTLEPWLLRAVILHATNTVIGHIGFHGGPDTAQQRDYAPGGVELGYSIFPAYRRQGYAREAVAGMMDWATHEHGVDQFVLCISPDNAPSRRIAQHFGFQQVGTVMDEEDGPEDVFIRRVDSIVEP